MYKCRYTDMYIFTPVQTHILHIYTYLYMYACGCIYARLQRENCLTTKETARLRGTIRSIATGEFLIVIDYLYVRGIRCFAMCVVQYPKQIQESWFKKG